MRRLELPKVLVVSTNAWRDNTGINTLIEFFKCWDSSRIAQIYTKTALPSTAVCNRFFRISENAVIKSVFKRRTVTGEVVQNRFAIDDHDFAAVAQEQKLYASYKGGCIRAFMSICREFVWKIGKWKTAELDKFIRDFDADVLYIPIYPTIYMSRIQKYVIQKAQKPVVSYLADDNYTYKAVGKNPIALLQRYILRKYIRYIVENSAKLMVIAPKQKEEYDQIFGCDSVVMTKGIDFDAVFQEKAINQPIKMVYTGKLIIGRWKSLAAIAEAMGKINQDKILIELDIYTTDTLSQEQSKALNRNGCTVKGALTLEEVKRVQSEADILVFVESLEKKYKNAARLSFSTKITDYLKSEKCIFAIGDKDIAPIDYFNRYDSAVTASSYGEISEKLEYLVKNPEAIEQYGKKGYACGVEHHERSKMNQLLIDTICTASKERGNCNG